MRYQVFGNHSGLRVSQLALGTGNFGTAWGYGAELDEARRMFGRYLEAGGNFIDTADNYQVGQSESLLSELIAPVREKVVLASKFTLGLMPEQAGIAAVGNSRKVMLQSVEASLKRLNTDRIDLLWVHMPDGVTPMEEIMRGLDDLARAGKIVYAGLSDFPAWRAGASRGRPHWPSYAARCRLLACKSNTAWWSGLRSVNCGQWPRHWVWARWGGRPWAAVS